MLTDLFWRFSFACECHFFTVVELSKRRSSAYYVSSFKTQLSSSSFFLFFFSCLLLLENNSETCLYMVCKATHTVFCGFGSGIVSHLDVDFRQKDCL